MDILPLESNIQVAVGTAFGEIHVWSSSTETINSAQNAKTLLGHEGAIHRVAWAPDGNALVSSSDDRSVRLWRHESNEWKEQWAAWGHSARVWSTTFVSNAIVSVAEDCTVRLWAKDDGSALACIQHPYPLWSVSAKDHLAVVGSVDGTVSLYDLTTYFNDSERSLPPTVCIPDDRPLPLPMQQKAPTEPSEETVKPKKPPSQVVVGLHWISTTRIILATRDGSLMTVDLLTNTWTSAAKWWSEEMRQSHDILPSAGCHMAVSGNRIAIGTTLGHIVLSSSLSEIAPTVLEARRLKSVQGLRWLEGEKLVSFHVRSIALWWNPLEESCSCTILNLTTKGVPLCCGFEDMNRVFVGDSRGNLSMYIVNTANDNNSPLDPVSSLLRVHEKEHVKDIAVQGERVFSVGNDGCVRISYWVGSSLAHGWSIPVPSMTGVEKIWLSNNAGFVAGYFGNKYRIVDISSGVELFRADTGGRQRQYAFRTNIDGHYLAVCNSEKDGSNTLSLFTETGQMVNEQTRHTGVSLHGETIFDATFFSLQGPSGPTVFLLTGSEDCGSKICRCEDGTILDSFPLTPQESCVRSVCSSQIDASAALLVVGGGKLALQFFLVSATTTTAAGACRGFLGDTKVQYIGKGATRRNASIDHRINAVKAIPAMESERLHFVVAGDSNGQCHIFLIHEELDKRIHTSPVMELSSRPILSLDLCVVGDWILVAIGTTGGDVQIYAMSKNMKDFAGSAESSTLLQVVLHPLASYQAHQVGTNTLSLRATSQGDESYGVHIVSGGDDQALCHCEFPVGKGPNGTLEALVNPKLAPVHCASFSALKGIASIEHSGSHGIVATGYTQHLSYWQFVSSSTADTSSNKQSDKNIQSLVCGENVPVDVGDVNCLAVYQDGVDSILVAVGGLGVELFKLA
eukprot:Nitzschia sp. Nitz4//scaffold338_size18487//3825//6554//NITZ4_008787-RA/size18487-processed-gene-0.11-mRNA-1//-1//CDS//3329548332//719//frame0